MIRVASALVAAASLYTVVPNAYAKTPGKTYCFHGVCHTVKTLEETRRLVGQTTTVKASHYDDPKKDAYNPSNLTSSGEYFRAWKADNAASPVYPNGTKLLVWHPGTKKAVTVRINNAGPYWRDRKLDLSRAAADALGMGGVATLNVRVIEAPSKAEATYSKGRTYAPVKGYMGQFASLDAAYSAANGRGTPEPAKATRTASAEPPTAPAAPKPERVASVTPAKAANPLAAAVLPEAAARKAAPVEKTPVVVASADKLPPETPIEITAAPRSAKARKDGDDNPLAEAIRRLAEREVENFTRIAQLR